MIFGAIPSANAQVPAGRFRHTAVWTGSEMIIWGGSGASSTLNTGGIYNPASNTWRPTSTNNAPTAREYHSAVWTGTEMIVWGGRPNTGAGGELSDGARYNPATDTWTPLPSLNAPSMRARHTAVWTGTEMIVWGGSYYNAGEVFLGNGARYNPTSNTWNPTPATGAPFPRAGHTAVWTGSRMVVWAGVVDDGASDPVKDRDGGRYDSGTGTWTPTVLSTAPTNRTFHTAVWTGTRMIGWGGFGIAVPALNDGGIYDPQTDTWQATATSGAPPARYYHTAVWNGSGMMVWGGFSGTGYLSDGGTLNAASNTWTTIATAGAPAARMEHTAVWTGREMIVWGGIGTGGTRLNSMGRYLPEINTWTAAPNCQWVTPTNGATLPFTNALPLAATASDSDGTIALVEFYANNTLVSSTNSGSGTNYSGTWNNPLPGTNTLYAVATDNAGARSTSAPVTLTLTAPIPPTVALTSPASNAILPELSNISLSANASDTDGTIAQVSFHAGGLLLGTDTSAPYTLTWSNVAAGTYTLTARATDSSGLTTTSAPVSITVNARPTVAITNPANNALVLFNGTIPVQAAAADADGTVAQVQFLANGTPVGTVLTPPYAVNWSNSTLGFFTLTAVATDNNGLSRTSAPVTVESVLRPLLNVYRVAGQPENYLQLTGGQTNRSYRFQRSTNLVNWTDFSTNTATNGSALILDLAPASEPRRFYRALP